MHNAQHQDALDAPVEVLEQLQESQQLSCCTMFGHFEAVTVVSINILQEG